METPPIERDTFLKALAQHIENEKDNGKENKSNASLGLILINICNLAEINHSTSFQHGDALLIESLSRLLSISKLPNTVYRIGGHHFAFILPGLSNPAFLILAANRITQLLTESFSFLEDTFDADIRLGYALNKDKTQPLDELGYLTLAEQSLKNADSGQAFTALSESKESKQQDNILLEKYFKEALRSNSFELFYQPKLNLKTGQVDKAEALLRWISPELGFISPEVVVDLAEKHGEEYTLTKWVVHTAVRQIKQWQTTSNIGVAVNIQASLLAGPDLVKLVSDALAIWGTDVSKLTLEITESAVIEDKESGMDNLQQLRDKGIELSIDDFGTGYSSFSYFKDIPATELKIDKAFVLNLLSNEQDKHIVKIMIDIAHVFGLKVVAEGIEDEATLNYLIELGCDYGQGYFISRPIPAKDFETWLNNYSQQPIPI